MGLLYEGLLIVSLRVQFKDFVLTEGDQDKNNVNSFNLVVNFLFRVACKEIKIWSCTALAADSKLIFFRDLNSSCCLFHMGVPFPFQLLPADHIRVVPFMEGQKQFVSVL